MTFPRVTIITVSFNASSIIEETMRSVLEQTYEDMEYLIIDGASKDTTIEIANRVASDYPSKRTYIISEQDEGLYDAMNKGVRKASGKWCAFMNCGDKYDNSGVLSSVFSNSSQIKGKKIIYGNTLFLHKDGTISFHSTATLENLSRIIHQYQPFCHQSAFFNIEDKGDCVFNLHYRIGADYDVCCRYYKKYGLGAFSYLNVTIADYKAYDGVSSDRRTLKREHLLVKVRNRMSILEVIKNAVSYLFRIG